LEATVALAVPPAELALPLLLPLLLLPFAPVWFLSFLLSEVLAVLVAAVVPVPEPDPDPVPVPVPVPEPVFKLVLVEEELVEEVLPFAETLPATVMALASKLTDPLLPPVLETAPFTVIAWAVAVI